MAMGSQDTKRYVLPRCVIYRPLSDENGDMLARLTEFTSATTRVRPKPNWPTNPFTEVTAISPCAVDEDRAPTIEVPPDIRIPTYLDRHSTWRKQSERAIRGEFRGTLPLFQPSVSVTMPSRQRLIPWKQYRGRTAVISPQLRLVGRFLTSSKSSN